MCAVRVVSVALPLSGSTSHRHCTVCATVSAVVRVSVYVRTSATPALICMAPPVRVVVGAPVVATAHASVDGSQYGIHVMYDPAE